MKNKTRVDGIEIVLDDGDSNTSDITYYDETYAEEMDAERIEWLKKQLRYYGYKFINEDEIREE